MQTSTGQTFTVPTTASSGLTGQAEGQLENPVPALSFLRSMWLAQQGYLFHWTPVMFGAGIGIYFALKWEPSTGFYLGLGAGILAVAGLLSLWRSIWSPILWAVLLVALGIGAAGLRAHSMAGPVLDWRYYGAVQGRIVGMDRSSSDAVRLTLDRVVLANVRPEKTPGRVRVSLHGQQGFVDPSPGMTVILTAHLSPPSGPVEPAGFDFQRHAWFLGLGAVGYTRTPVLTLAPAQSGQWLFKARMALSDHVQDMLPGEAGGFAAAIMAGDRSGIAQETLKDLRISNLAHLLAISGLHMALLTGFVFSALRLGFAAVPRVGLRIPGKKYAAIGALVAGAGYLGLSGGNVATERAFIMVAVMFCAILIDRRAVSLRSVAIAAFIVLALRPEALLGPGFQMSFAATAALVFAFNLVRDHDLRFGPQWMQPVAGVVLSSLVAGLATAPIAAAHFNQFAHYGLIANLLSVPLMGVLVMPAAVVAALLMPFGLDFIPLWVMGLGLDWILGVAHWTSDLDGARGMVASPDPVVLPLLALGALFVILWQGRARLIGVVPFVVGMILWSGTERPAVLIADTGGLIGVMTEDGRALNRERGAGFVALNWLENDGDKADQDGAHTRWPASDQAWPIVALRGQKAVDALSGCGGAKWLVLNKNPASVLQFEGCEVLTPRSLQKTGAIALYDRDGILKPVTARQVTGARLWNTWP
ncbi:MAG: ComEC/Rec2 family competence protein [Pseudomonadota bacterium]